MFVRLRPSEAPGGHRMTGSMAGSTPPPGVSVHPSAILESSEIGAGTRIGAFAHVLSGARIGANANVCDHVCIEGDVMIGDNATIKSGVQIWDGIRLEDNVFIGPNATFTNELYPRSKQPLASYIQTFLKEGCSVGAGSTILAGVTIGAH